MISLKKHIEQLSGRRQAESVLQSYETALHAIKAAFLPAFGDLSETYCRKVDELRAGVGPEPSSATLTRAGEQLEAELVRYRAEAEALLEQQDQELQRAVS